MKAKITASFTKRDRLEDEFDSQVPLNIAA